MIISFIGNDGSGKSSVVAEVVAELVRHNKKVKLVKEFDYFLLSLFKKLVRKDSVTRIQADLNATRTTSVSAKLLPYFLYIDLLFQYLYLKIFFPRTIVVRDRYAYDFLMTWEELKVSNSLLRFLYLRFPKPDLLFFVYLDPNTAYERRLAQRGEAKNIEFYKNKINLYKKFLANIPFVLIQNNTLLENSIQEVMHYITLKEKLSNIRSIAISGLDGAGKSTTINNLNSLLRTINVPYRSIHFYYNYIIVKGLRMIKKSKTIPDHERHAISVKKEREHLEKKRSVLWVWFVLIDAYVQYMFVRITHPRSILIFDRFFHDYLVSFAFLNAPHNPQFLRKIFPSPSRFFLQIAEYELLHKRKPEHTIVFFETCHELYMKHAEESNVIVLDSTSKDPDEILKELLSYV